MTYVRSRERKIILKILDYSKYFDRNYNNILGQDLKSNVFLVREVYLQGKKSEVNLIFYKVYSFWKKYFEIENCRLHRFGREKGHSLHV